MSLRSLTLQTGDTIVTSGETVGKLSYAASAESDGGSAIAIAASVYAQAENSFQTSSNPTSLVFATASASAGASGKIKITDNGHIMPMSNSVYDLGDQNLRYRNVFSTSGNFSGRVGVGTNNPQQLLDVSGTIKANHITAVTKSFFIDHPICPDKKLRYASLEGPENGVYIRGTTNLNIIVLPEYWSGLVDENSITVNLTPVGEFQPLFVANKNIHQITIGGGISYYDYIVYAERKDVAKLEVEPWA